MLKSCYRCQPLQIWYHHIIIISGFGIYGAAVVPDSGVGNTWQHLTLVLHEFLSNGLTPSRLHIVISFLTHGVSYSPCTVTMAVSLTVYEIFSVKVLRDLENWVRDCSRSLKMAPYYTTFYWSAIVNIALSGTAVELFDVEWYHDLEIWVKSHSFTFIQTGTIRKLGCGILFAFHSNYGRRIGYEYEYGCE